MARTHTVEPADVRTRTRASASLHPRALITPPGRVAMVGAGGFGRFCLEAYRQAEDISVVAIADPNLAGLTLPSHPDLPIRSDWRTILEDPSVEVIHLATPPFLRSEIALPAMRAGKSVFCEKPLALSLDEADQMLAVACETGTVVGVNYVLRHHPAFQLLALLASSGLFGAVRTLSLQNFAQALPDDHWMWDQTKSGGILVEHGVHFFDAYGQIAGKPVETWGTRPRKEAVQVMVRYAGGEIGSYWHEFGYPEAVERTHGIVLFEQGYVEIDGWIPERLHGRVVASSGTLEEILASGYPLADHAIEAAGDADVTRFEVRFPDRQWAYQRAIVDGMRDVLARHRDPRHVMTVSTQDAHASLALALAARRATEAGVAVRLSD